MKDSEEFIHQLTPSTEEWIGVDMDGVLVEYHGFKGHGVLGAPILPMIERVKGWLKKKKRVKIFTSRVAGGYGGDGVRKNFLAIQKFCQLHFDVVLPITCIKDQFCREMWDDRAIQMIPNTGLTLSEYLDSQT